MYKYIRNYRITRNVGDIDSGYQFRDTVRGFGPSFDTMIPDTRYQIPERRCARTDVAAMCTPNGVFN